MWRRSSQMRKRAQSAAWFWAAASLATCTYAATAPSLHTLRAVRIGPQGATTRIIIDTDGEIAVATGTLHHPERVYFDLKNTRPAGAKLRTIGGSKDGLVQKVRLALTQRTVTRVVVDLSEAAEFETSQSVNPARLVIELRRAGTPHSSGHIDQL